MKLSHACLAAALAACGGSSAAPPDAPADASPPDAPLPDSRPATVHTYYLDFDGQALTPGPDDPEHDVSSLVQKPFTAPPYLAGDPDRAAKIAAIVAEVQQVLAPYDVAVVTTRPAPGVAYDLLVAGGKEADAGLPVVDALTSTRNCDATGAHVMLLFDDLSAQHDAARAIVGMLGVAHGISQSKVHDDCMCYTGCGFGLTSACTIGGAGTPVNAMYACTVDTTMDEQAAWRQTFGARP